MPVIDHGLDELKIWAFNLTGYNQEVIRNQYTSNMWNATKSMHVPFWGQKLFTPAFYREEKLETFNRQWGARIGLEIIKMRHAMTNKMGDEVQRRKQKDEIESYIKKVYDDEAQQQLKEVYVTNHEAKKSRYHTTSKKEDEQFFTYKQALEEYNNEPVVSFSVKKEEKYERGSLKQKLFDPLAGAEKLENGALFYRVSDKELSADLSNEDALKAEFERLKALNSGVLEASEDDLNELRMALLDEMEESTPFTAEDFGELLDRELGVFKTGEKYDFVRDVKDAFAGSLEKTAADKILETIPDHAFWDIKTPVKADPQRFMNPYNSFRKYHTSSFFDAREYEEYMDRRKLKQNLRDGVSTYRRY